MPCGGTGGGGGGQQQQPGKTCHAPEQKWDPARETLAVCIEFVNKPKNRSLGLLREGRDQQRARVHGVQLQHHELVVPTRCRWAIVEIG
jgi:hypothetical protein